MERKKKILCKADKRQNFRIKADRFNRHDDPRNCRQNGSHPVILLEKKKMREGEKKRGKEKKGKKPCRFGHLCLL